MPRPARKNKLQQSYKVFTFLIYTVDATLAHMFERVRGLKFDAHDTFHNYRVSVPSTVFQANVRLNVNLDNKENFVILKQISHSFMDKAGLSIRCFRANLNVIHPKLLFARRSHCKYISEGYRYSIGILPIYQQIL